MLGRMVALPRRLLGFLVASALLLAARPAAAYDALYVFGDSLSDVGNLGLATGGAIPGPSYFNGRFSNGPNYVDDLSAALGLGPASPSLAGGNDYAYGGARLTGLPVPPTVPAQVTTYLAANPVAGENGLYVLFGGANDLIARLGGDATVSVPAAVDALAAQVGGLYDAGGREFLTPNLPSLGLIPQFNADPVAAAAATALTAQFNALYAAALDDLELSRPDLVLHRVDVAALFAAVAADPAAFGLDNAADPAAPGLSPGLQDYDASLIVPDADRYLFWDQLHPTQSGHALLARSFLAAVPEPGSLSVLVLAAPLALRRRGRAV